VATEPRLWRLAGDYLEWTSRAGCLVRIDVLAQRSGAAHCGHQDASVIITGTPFGARYTSPQDARLYIRDPKGSYRNTALTKGFDPRAVLPGSAVDSGFRRDNIELWYDPEDVKSIYLKSPSGVERWPLGFEPPCE
jgi:hypothetical protein